MNQYSEYKDAHYVILLFPVLASEQGSVIGLVSMYIHILCVYICVQKNCTLGK